MKYNPVKQQLTAVIKKNGVLRVALYKFLDVVLLRSWYIHKELRQWSKNKNNDSMHILDAGAGFGQYTYHLASKHPAWNILAIDNKPEMVCQCNTFFRNKKIQNIYYKRGNLPEYTSNESFDLILSVDVIEKIQEDDQVLHNFSQSLKDEGMLLLSVSSDKDQGVNLCEENVRNGYSLSEIRQKLQKAGFKKIETEYTYGKSGKIAWLLSMKYPIKALQQSKLWMALLPVYYMIVGPLCYLLNAHDLHTKLTNGSGMVIKAWK